MTPKLAPTTDKPVVIHHVKTWPKEFENIVRGTKTGEVRKNDRDYRVGDYIRHFEYDPETKLKSGRTVLTEITYVTLGEEMKHFYRDILIGVSKLIFMSIRKVSEKE